MTTPTSLLELHARELAGMDEEWMVYRYERVDVDPPFLVAHLALTGALVAGYYLSGPRKGRPRWDKIKSKERTVRFTQAEHDAWCAAWSVKTGLCSACVGAGRTAFAWSRKSGPEYRGCKECEGSGKAKEAGV